MSNKFVLDSSLFKKYSFAGDYRKDKSHSIDNLIMELISENKYENVFLELRSFMNILEAVEKRKAAIHVNKEILDEYLKHIGEIPDEMELLISAFVSDTRCLKNEKDESGGLNHHERTHIECTPLKYKLIYIDLSKTINPSIIVSTIEDKREVYRPNKNIMIKYGISCRHACEHWNEINKRP